MKQGRKFITLILSLALMMALLAACSGNGTEEQSSAAPSDRASSDNTPAGAESNPSKEGQSDGKTGKVLVAYFTRVGSTSPSEDEDAVSSASLRVGDTRLIGNTEVIADMVQEAVGGDLLQIETAQPYPEEYDAVVEQARKERDSGYKPPLSTKVENMDSYDVVYLGYPTWGMTIPAPVASFLSEYDFSGKTIVPFCTNAGYGPGQSVSAIKELSPGAIVLDGFDIVGREAATAQGAVSAWLREIGMLEKN
ncbi:Flavodoxin [Paenibacillus sophorae]|uniref:Flavodoxin n=1 Tax=Paenibacillus sophorae TaxID=1333845 RepID=A0A1H8SGE0_9BACL|nr:flavodoxin [Paenibacillus sophorae]QWU16725.1 hypothetical protein KP014_05775 [Paenibacillus sophorae]SEO77424.1 Flavodoxin [Paenibacillus sophorae]